MKDDKVIYDSPAFAAIQTSGVNVTIYRRSDDAAVHLSESKVTGHNPAREVIAALKAFACLKHNIRQDLTEPIESYLNSFLRNADGHV
jgi:hypothetical protein